jgi:ABC-2 type transport system ATP-binding protein
VISLPHDGLVIDDLHRTFGNVQALRGMSMSVRPGSLHGFVGANGAGKTTLMRIVVGVERADRGHILMHGAPIGPAARPRIGYLPEERGLYPDMRVADQVAYPGRLHGMSKADASSSAGALLDRLGLAGRARDPTTALSLGNQQRVQLAAALVHEPDLLLLDEPFSGLDPIATDVMAQLLSEQAARGVPVLFSSHQLELVERLCDTVTIIADGRLVASGSIEELRSRRVGRRIAVGVDGDPPDWATLPGVTGVSHTHGTGSDVTLTLDDTADDQLVLDAARAAGRVRSFAPVQPSLAELYREVTA